MPELPEVETLRLQLSQLVVGLTIKDIEILNPKSFIGGKRLILGKKIIGVRRFAKILVIDLADGLSLAIHLKMSGQLIYRGVKNKHTRVIITFTNGVRLYFHDQRIFGWIRVVHDIAKMVNKLGPDPLKDLSVDKFKKILKSSKRPVKLVLMDQEKIAGVGNIYANDALFLSGIHPKTSANKLLDGQMVKLFRNLLKVLKDGIKWGGASRDHFRDVYGRKGQVQEHFYVYDKAGKKCINDCGNKIERIKLGGRGTFFCPKCQNLV